MSAVYPSIVNVKMWKFNSVSNNEGMVKLVTLNLCDRILGFHEK